MGKMMNKLIDAASLAFGKLLAWSLVIIVTALMSAVFLWPLWIVLVLV